jgi:hypothetical protein
MPALNNGTVMQLQNIRYQYVFHYFINQACYKAKVYETMNKDDLNSNAVIAQRVV